MPTDIHLKMATEQSSGWDLKPDSSMQMPQRRNSDTSSVSSACFHNGGYELSFHEWQGSLCVRALSRICMQKVSSSSSDVWPEWRQIGIWDCGMGAGKFHCFCHVVPGEQFFEAASPQRRNSDISVTSAWFHNGQYFYVVVAVEMSLCVCVCVCVFLFSPSQIIKFRVKQPRTN